MFITMPQDTPKLIAIVDDDDLIRSALEMLMEVSGLDAFSCASAEEFLQSSKKQHTACLVTDIRMPGMSGLELQSRLNADHQRIPIIFMTAHGDEGMRLQAKRAGAVEFLAKPFVSEWLWSDDGPEGRTSRYTVGFLQIIRPPLASLGVWDGYSAESFVG